MEWFDTHFHLDEGDDAPADVLSAAREVGVTRFLILGTDDASCAFTTSLADPAQGVYVAAGLHPHAAQSYTDTTRYREWLATPGAVAVGEIGLDYFYDFSERTAQRAVFEVFFNLAQELGLPAVIHCREAFQDCFDIVKANIAKGQRFLIHSIADTPRECELWLEEGAMLSFNGMATFKRSDNIRETLAVVPLDHLLLETDSPYLAPVPHRGKRNCPAFLPIIGAFVAAQKGVTTEELATITTRNARVFFCV